MTVGEGQVAKHEGAAVCTAPKKEAVWQLLDTILSIDLMLLP